MLKEEQLKMDIERAMKEIDENDQQLDFLPRLIADIMNELQIDDDIGNGVRAGSRRISSLVHDNIQCVDTQELLLRLKLRLEDSTTAFRDATIRKKELNIVMSNLKDDLECVHEEQRLETSTLMTRNLLYHRIRLMTFNSLGLHDNCKENDALSTLVAITVGKDVFIYDSITGNPIQVFEGDTMYGESSHMKGHSAIITSILFEGNTVYSGGMDKKMCAWDIVSGSLLYVANGHDCTITCIVSSQEDTVISGSADKTCIVWNKNNGLHLHRLSGHSRGILSLHEGYSTIVSGDADGEIFIWDSKEVRFMT
jgi:WD40 repeat protein